MIFTVWIVFVCLEQKTNPNHIKEYVKPKIFLNTNLLSEDTWIFEFNQYQKSDKAPFTIYADIQFTIETVDVCKNNSENSSTTNVSKYIPSGFSMSTKPSFNSIQNKHDVYSGKHCMKIVCQSLGEYAMRIINFKKKK